MGQYRLKLRAELGQLKTDLIAAEALAQRSIREIRRMMRGGFTFDVRIDPTQLAQNSALLQNWVEQQRTAIDVGVRLVGMDRAELEINQLQQRLNTSLQLGVQVELFGIDRMRNDLDRLRNTLQNPLKIQVDDRRLYELNEHFALKEKHYQQLQRLFRDNPLTVRVNDSELVNTVNRPNSAKVKVDLESSRIDSDIDRVVKKLDQLKPTNNLLKAVSFAPTKIATGFLEGFGQSLSKDLGTGYTQGIQAALGDTIGSTELFGRKMAEGIANRARNAIGQLVPTAVTDALRESINKSLGESDVYIESRSRQASQSRSQRNKKEAAREGVAEERRDTVRQFISRTQEFDALKTESERLDKLYLAKNRIKTIIDDKLESRSPNSRSRARFEQISANLEFDLDRILQEQIQVGKALRNSRNRLEIEESQKERAETVYQSLKPQPLPKIYRDAFEGVPEHLIPELVVDKTLKSRGAHATYSAKVNQLRVTPEMKKDMERGELTPQQYEILYHERQHAFDFQFGQFQGLIDRDNLEVRNPLKATPEEIRDVAPFIAKYDPELRAVEQNAEIAGRRNRDIKFEEQRRKQLADGLSNTFGIAGFRLEKVVGIQADNVINRALNVNKLAVDNGVVSPDAAQIVKQAARIKASQQQISLDIAKSSTGELNSQQIEEIADRITSQLDAISELDEKIQILKENIFKEISATKKKAESQTTEKNDDPWSDAKTAAGKMAVKAAGTAGQVAGTVVSKIGGAVENFAVDRVNSQLAKIPGQPGVIDINPRKVGSLSELQGGDYLHMAQLGATSAGNALSAGYNVLQGVENAVFGAVPLLGGVKKVTQGVALPAAAFGTIAALPGVGTVAQGLVHGAQGLAALPAHGMAEMLGAQATALISQSLGSVPVVGNAIAPALSQAVTGMLSASLGGAAELGAGLVAPVVGGSIALQGAKAGAKVLLPGGVQDSTKLQIAAQKQAEGAIVKLEQFTQNLEYVASAVPLPQLTGKANQSLPPAKPTTPTLPNSPTPQLQLKASTELSEADAIERAKLLAQKFAQAKKAIEKAIKNGETQLAVEMGKQIEHYGELAQNEIASITSILGDKAGIGTKLGSQLANAKSQISKAKNSSNRAIKVYKSQNRNIPDDELASKRELSIPNILGDELFSKREEDEEEIRRKQLEEAKRKKKEQEEYYKNINTPDQKAKRKAERKFERQKRSELLDAIDIFSTTGKSDRIVNFLATTESIEDKNAERYFIDFISEDLSNQQSRLRDTVAYQKRGQLDEKEKRYLSTQELKDYELSRKKYAEEIKELEAKIDLLQKLLAKDFSPPKPSEAPKSPKTQEITPPKPPEPPKPPKTQEITPPKPPEAPKSPKTQEITPPKPSKTQEITPPVSKKQKYRTIPDPWRENAPEGQSIEFPKGEKQVFGTFPNPWGEENEFPARPLNKNNNELVASAQKNMSIFDAAYSLLNRQLKRDEKSGRRQTNRFLNQNQRTQRRFDRAYDQIDKESSKELQQQMEETDRAINTVFGDDGSINPIPPKVNTLTGLFGGLTKAAMGLVAGFGGFVVLSYAAKYLSDFTSKANEFEQALLKLQTSTGSLVAGANKFQSLRQQAAQIGVSQSLALSMGAGFAGTTFGGDLEGAPTDRITKQALTLVQRRGMNRATAQSLELVLKQILAKPRVSAEEMNQLVESGGMPDARAIAARSMGMSLGQFTKAMESGSGIDSQKFVQKFLTQANTDSLLISEQSLNTQQAKLTKLESSVENLQLTIGQGIDPAFKLGLDVLSGSIELLKNGIELGSKALIGFGISLIPAVTRGLISLGNTAIASAGSVKALGSALTAIAGKAILFYALGEAVGFFLNKMKDGAEETNNQTKAIGRLIDEYNRLNNIKTEPKALPKASNEIWSSQKGWGGLVENAMLGAERFLIKPFFAPWKLNEKTGKFERSWNDAKQKNSTDKNDALTDIQKQQPDRENIIRQAIDLAKQPEAERINQEISRINSQRSALAITNPGNTAQMDAYKQRIQELYRQLSDREDKLSPAKAIAQSSVNQYKGLLDELAQRKADGQVTEGDYNRLLEEYSSGLQRAKSLQDKLNLAIKSPLEDLTGWNYQLDAIATKFADITTEAQTTNNQLAAARNLSEIAGQITKGQSEYQADLQNQKAITDRIEASKKVADELQRALDIKDPGAVSNIKSAYQIDDSTSAAQINLKANSSSSEYDKQILQKLAVIKEQGLEVSNLELQLSEARKEMNRRIEQEFREAVQFYVGIARQIDPKDQAFSKALSDITQQRNRFLAKLNGFGNGLADGYINALLDLFESGKRQLESVAQNYRDKKRALEGYQDRNVEIDTRSRNSYGGEATPGDSRSAVTQSLGVASGINSTSNPQLYEQRSGKVTQTQLKTTTDFIQSAYGKNEQLLKQQQEEADRNLLTQQTDETLKQIRQAQLAKREGKKAERELQRQSRQQQNQFRNLNPPVTIQEKQSRELSDYQFNAQESKLNFGEFRQNLTDTVGDFYELIKYLESVKDRSPEQERELQRLRDITAKLRGQLDGVNKSFAQVDKKIQDGRKIIESQQKYDREVAAEQVRVNENSLKANQAQADRSRVQQQLKSQSLNPELNLRDRQLESESQRYQIENEKIQSLRQLKEDERSGKLAITRNPQQVRDYVARRRSEILATEQKKLKALSENQAQRSAEFDRTVEQENKQLSLSELQSQVSLQGIKARELGIRDRAKAPFADDLALEAQRKSDLAALQVERENKLFENEQKRLKVKGNRPLLDKIDASDKLIRAEYEAKRGANQAEYEQNVRDRARERTAYGFGQREAIDRSRLAIFQARDIDRQKVFGLDTRQADFRQAYYDKKVGFERQRFDLTQQRDSITGIDQASIDARKNIQELIDNLNSLEKIELGNLAAQFDPLNSALADMRKATKDVFQSFAMEGKFEWQKILQAPLANLTSQLMEGVTTNLFSGLFRSPQNKPEETPNLLGQIFGGLFGGGGGLKFATGGIAPGGFRAFATGGVVKTPTIGLVGEGVYNEAVVPLPDGKSIPVVMNQNQGASGNISSSVSVTVNNNGSGERSTAGNTNQLSNAIEAAVMSVLARERRSGGLAY